MRRLASGIGLACALFLTACEFSGPLDGVGGLNPLVAVDSFRTVITGVVLDAATGDPIASMAELSFAGEAGDLVRDLLGRPVEGWTPTDGFASFGIANSVRPRTDRPVDLRVIARAAGYRTNSARVEMRRDGRHEFRVVLAAEGRASEAVHGFGEFQLRGGATVEQTVVSAVAAGQGVLQVLIPSGTVVASESNEVLDGALVLESSWQPPSARSLSQFPGGLGSGVRLKGGPDIPATLTTGALISLRVSEVESPEFSDSLEVTAIVSPFLKSPRTNAPILAGDVVDVLRWKPDEGIWLEHAQSTVERAGGGLAATFRSAKPGTFSIGFSNSHCGDARVTLTGNRRGGSIVAWHGSPGQADAQRVWRFGPGESEVLLEGPPGFWQGTLEARHGQEVQSVRYAGLCDAQFDFVLEPSPAPDLVEVTARPLGCSALSVTDVPTLSVLAIPSPSPLAGEGALLGPPYAVKSLAASRTTAGRVTGFSFGPVGADDTRYLILGGRHWLYPPEQDGVLDISDMARESGLCS